MAELTPIRYPAKYIAELFSRVSGNYDLRIASQDDVYAGVSNIYAFSIAPLVVDPSNYWIAWGGYFDNPTGFGYQVYFDAFLRQSVSAAAMELTENSFFVDIENYKIYVHLPINPWQYFRRNVYLYSNENATYSTAPKNERNPSDIYYGAVKVLPRMAVPSLEQSLSDAIAGIEVYNSFKIDLDNADGRFDGINIVSFINTPIKVSKTTENAQDIIDFNQIRNGIITDISVDKSSYSIEGTDQFYLMQSDVCRRISTDEFPNAETDAIDTEIPILWGSATVELIFLYEDSGTYYYIAGDKDYITDVTACYDDTGASQTFSFTVSTGVISASVELETADVQGRQDSRLATVIKEALFRYENIQYVEGIWDITEFERYLDICPNINLYVDGGNTKELITAALENDIAFLIMKHDGRLTIRRWGEEYEIHVVPVSAITVFPKKDFRNATKYFCSAVQVDYSGGTIFDDSQQNEISDAANGRKNTVILPTVLSSKTEAEDLAARFLDRFGTVRETIQAGWGVDTFQVNFLDTLQIEYIINDRIFSEYSRWIVTKVDPGQDMLTAEGTEILYVLTYDGYDASIDNDYLLAVNS